MLKLAIHNFYQRHRFFVDHRIDLTSRRIFSIFLILLIEQLKLSRARHIIFQKYSTFKFHGQIDMAKMLLSGSMNDFSSARHLLDNLQVNETQH